MDGLKRPRKVVGQGAYLSIGGQHFEEAFFPINLLEDDQTLPCFTAVVGLLLVFPEEEESIVGRRKRLEQAARASEK